MSRDIPEDWRSGDYKLALDANNTLHLMQIVVDTQKPIRNNAPSIQAVHVNRSQS